MTEFTICMNFPFKFCLSSLGQKRHMEAPSLENLISTMSVPDTLFIFIETHYNSEFVYSVWSHCGPHGTCWNHYISKFTALFLSKAIFCKISICVAAYRTPPQTYRVHIHNRLHVETASTPSFLWTTYPHINKQQFTPLYTDFTVV